MYSSVIFDFFGVFCSSIATAWFKKNVHGFESKLGALEALCTESDLGKITRAEFNKRLSVLTGIPAADVEAGIEAEVAVNTALADYASSLKTRGYRLACLSNGTQEWTLQIMTDHGLRPLFDEVVLSADLGIIKPDPAIYHHMLNILGATAPQAIFVDDRKLNTDAAEACGIRSLVFTDTPTFITDFESLTIRA